MEPALAALLLRSRIPRDRQRLFAAVGKIDQILLQRMHAERVADFVVVQLAIGTVGVDDELAVALRKNVDVVPAYVNFASLKLPSTDVSLATCIARS